MGRIDKERGMDRRSFVKTTAAAALYAAAPLAGARETGSVAGACRNQRDAMRYQQLGRSGILSSRLVFGGGAALSRGRVGGDRLLSRAFEAGINFYDLGFNDYYKGAEKSFAPFLKAHRDDVWVVSKAPVPVPEGHTPGTPFTTEEGKRMARHWTSKLEASLVALGQDHVDGYYLMAVDSADVVSCEALYDAFQTAKAAGKVERFGLSTHKNAQDCLATAVATGWYDLAMIAVTPAGWYDWDSKNLLEGTPSLKALRPALDQARDAGIGLIGMKAVRFIAPPAAGGRNDTAAFDSFYDARAMGSGLTPFQRSYAYVLENGLDVVNADMQNLKHLEENLVASARSSECFA